MYPQFPKFGSNLPTTEVKKAEASQLIFFPFEEKCTARTLFTYLQYPITSKKPVTLGLNVKEMQRSAWQLSKPPQTWTSLCRIHFSVLLMELVNEWAAARRSRSLHISPSAMSDSVGHLFEVLREKWGVRKGLVAWAHLSQTQRSHTLPSPPTHHPAGIQAWCSLARLNLPYPQSKSRGGNLHKVLIQ